MAKKRIPSVPYVQPCRYPSPNIPLTAIRRFARRIAERFQPDKIILFGSYAYGRPHAESDVDLLVIMPASDVVNQSIRICLAFERPFSLDLIVRTPRQVARGVKEGDWFLREITEKGKVLYEAANGSVGSQSRGGLDRGARTRRPNAAPRDLTCFHCQQAAEKYFKALRQENGAAVPRTHDPEELLDLLLPHDAHSRRSDERSSRSAGTPWIFATQASGPRHEQCKRPFAMLTAFGANFGAGSACHPNPDYSKPSLRGCRPWASSPWVGALRPGSPLWAHRPLTPRRGRHGDRLSGRLAGGICNRRREGIAQALAHPKIPAEVWPA
jgi:predicted nucleotidyltransferase